MKLSQQGPLTPAMSTRTCVHCGSDRLEYEPTARLWWCLECAGASTISQTVPPDPLLTDFTCQECGQDIDLVEDGTIRHERQDLVAPKCTIHKAEMVAARRASFRVVT